jgi:hypothetical protein
MDERQMTRRDFVKVAGVGTAAAALKLPGRKYGRANRSGQRDARPYAQLDGMCARSESARRLHPRRLRPFGRAVHDDRGHAHGEARRV